MRNAGLEEAQAENKTAGYEVGGCKDRAWMLQYK